MTIKSADERAAQLLDAIRSAASLPPELPPSTTWRKACSRDIEAHCLAHRGSKFAYVTYTLPAFGFSNLRDLSDHQLQQVYAQVTSTAPDLSSLACGLFANPGHRGSNRVQFLGFLGRFGSKVGAGLHAMISSLRQALSSPPTDSDVGSNRVPAHNQVMRKHSFRGYSGLPSMMVIEAWAFAWRTLTSAELLFGLSSGQGGLGWYVFQNRNELYRFTAPSGSLCAA